MIEDKTTIKIKEIAKKLGIKRQIVYGRLRNGYAKWKPRELKVLDKYGGLESVEKEYNEHLISHRKKMRLKIVMAKILNVETDTINEKFSGKRRFSDGELMLLSKGLTKEEKELFGEIRYDRRNSKQIHN